MRPDKDDTISISLTDECSLTCLLHVFVLFWLFRKLISKKPIDGSGSGSDGSGTDGSGSDGSGTDGSGTGGSGSDVREVTVRELTVRELTVREVTGSHAIHQ